MTTLDKKLEEILSGFEVIETNHRYHHEHDKQKLTQSLLSLFSNLVDEELEEFSEYCHTRYKGCTMDEYAYDSEITNMAGDYKLERQRKLKILGGE